MTKKREVSCDVQKNSPRLVMFKKAAHGYAFPRCCFLAENINSLRSFDSKSL
jgi:hypothetical protein